MSQEMISVSRELLAEILDKMQPIYSLPPKYYGSTLGDRVRTVLAQHCTCPSGDGSLRWPCPVCPPEPVGWQFLQDGKWWNGDDRIKDHRLNTEAAGYPTRNVFASHPPAQAPVVLPAPWPEIMGIGVGYRGLGHAEGWNACLAELKRLNPGITEAAPLRKS